MAVILAAVANMAIGMVWYGPLLGKQWKALMGFTDESIRAMKIKPIQAMAGGFATALIMAFVLAHDAFVWGQFFGSSATQPIFALQLGFWIWLGYIATIQAGSVLWEGRPWKLYLINASNTLVSFMVMAFIITYLS